MLCIRLTVVQLQLTEDQKKLQNLQKTFVKQFGVGHGFESVWEKRYSIRLRPKASPSNASSVEAIEFI